MPTRKPEFQATVTCNRAVFARLWCQPIRGAHCTERATPHPARHDRGRRFSTAAAAAAGDKKKPADAVRGLLSCLLADCGASRANTN